MPNNATIFSAFSFLQSIIGMHAAFTTLVTIHVCGDFCLFSLQPELGVDIGGSAILQINHQFDLLI